MSGPEIHRRPLTQYGDSALQGRMVYGLIEKFKIGRSDVTHEAGAGGLATSTSHEKIHQARVMVMANRRVNTEEIACSL